MKITIDTDNNLLISEISGEKKSLGLYSKEAFELISEQWLIMGWKQKYSYTFTWMGRPVIQLPEDMLRIQELIYTLKPDNIIETGIAHGGSLIYYASLCKSMGKGRVIGIDIEIRPHNRKAIEEHELFPLITMFEGSSTSPDIFSQVKSLINNEEKTLLILDSNHTKEHVLNELNLYSELVSVNSFILVADGIMQALSSTPGCREDWKHDNPIEAVKEFLSTNSNFILEEPAFLFNESDLEQRITYYPWGILRRIS